MAVMKVIPNAKYQAGYNNERKITIIINNSGKLEEKRRKGRKRRKKLGSVSSSLKELLKCGMSIKEILLSSAY